MCGRTACTLAPSHIQQLLRCRSRDERADRLCTARYNVCPSQVCPVVLGDEQLGDDEQLEPLRVGAMRWGLQGVYSEPANARGETLMQKRSFAPLVAGHRCVMLVDGYYEWRNNFKTDSDDEARPVKLEAAKKKPRVSRVALKTAVKKQPFYFRPRDPAFPILMIAAFYKPASSSSSASSTTLTDSSSTTLTASSSTTSTDSSSTTSTDSSSSSATTSIDSSPISSTDNSSTSSTDLLADVKNERLASFALVTVKAHPDFADVHHRMPAVLRDMAAVKQWLFGPRPLDALRPVGSDFVEHYPVGGGVGRSQAEGAELVKPVTPKDPYAGPLDRFVRRGDCAPPSPPRRAAKRPSYFVSTDVSLVDLTAAATSEKRQRTALS